jgi:hypothetical protein
MPKQAGHSWNFTNYCPGCDHELQLNAQNKCVVCGYPATGYPADPPFESNRDDPTRLLVGSSRWTEGRGSEDWHQYQDGSTKFHINGEEVSPEEYKRRHQD